MGYGRLDVFLPDNQFESYVLDQEYIAVGRSTGNTIAIDNTAMSRYHFVLNYDGNRVLITDLEAVNGTFLDGLRLAANIPHELRGGEEIQAGEVRFVFQLEPGIQPGASADADLAEMAEAAASLPEPALDPPTSMGVQTQVIARTARHIFLSYSRKDNAMMARIRDTLRANALDVWTDELLEPGTPDWEHAIGSAIRIAGALVVVLSPDAEQSIWVGRELAMAETQDVRIFPVLVRGDSKTAVPFRLVSHQRVDARSEYDSAMHKLIAALQKHLEIQPRAGGDR